MIEYLLENPMLTAAVLMLVQAVLLVIAAVLGMRTGKLMRDATRNTKQLCEGIATAVRLGADQLDYLARLNIAVEKLAENTLFTIRSEDPT